MKKRKRVVLFVSLSFVQILIAVFIVVKKEDFIYIFPTKEAETLRDLAYDKDKRLGYTVHIKENEKLVPYLVLTKDYINQGNVLLLRKHLVDPPIPFRDGWEEAYYGNSLPDAFMNKDFIKRFSKGVQENITLTELGIKALKPNFEGRHIDKIKRKIFLLSDIDVGKYKQRIRLEEEQNLLYFKRKEGGNAVRLAFLKEGTVAYTWWLRTAFATDSAVAKTIEDGMFSGNGVAYPAYVRPSFTLPPETEVEEKEIDGRKAYILKIEK